MPPLVMEFQSLAVPDAKSQILLQMPWEILGNQNGFLADDAVYDFSPVRRIGSAGILPRLRDLCLGIVFMAASPRGAAALYFEAEENGILDATRHFAIDFEVEESGNPDRLAARLARADEMQVL
jgi:hypothetical protein